MLHVVFSGSAEASLRRALEDSSRSDEVVCYADPMSFGPIGPGRAEQRKAWIEDKFSDDLYEYYFTKTEAAISSSRKNPNCTAWFSRRSAPEYASFLDWLQRADPVQCSVVDLTDEHVASSPQMPVTSAGVVIAQQLSSYFDRQRVLDEAERYGFLRHWQSLCAENAPIRMTDGSKLRSAPITVFDREILSRATHDWLAANRIVGDCLAAFSGGGFHQTGDLLLCSRIEALIEAGQLEAHQNDDDWSAWTRIRLPDVTP